MNSDVAVLLDLFNTLVVLDTGSLPLLELGGRSRPSTLPRLQPALAEALPGVGLETFAAALKESYRTEEADGQAHLKEISSPRRFAAALERLGLGAAEATSSGAALSEQHMEQLLEIAVLPAGNREVLTELAGQVPLALVSNFDAAPWGHRILEKLDLTRFFEFIVFSDELGLRKPHPAIFLEATTMLGLDTRSCLMVGDDPRADIAGAADLSLQTAWIRPAGTSYPEGLQRPDWEISHLRELLGQPLERLLQA